MSGDLENLIDRVLPGFNYEGFIFVRDDLSISGEFILGRLTRMFLKNNNSESIIHLKLSPCCNRATSEVQKVCDENKIEAHLIDGVPKTFPLKAPAQLKHYIDVFRKSLEVINSKGQKSLVIIDGLEFVLSSGVAQMDLMCMLNITHNLLREKAGLVIARISDCMNNGYDPFIDISSALERISDIFFVLCRLKSGATMLSSGKLYVSLGGAQLIDVKDFHNNETKISANIVCENNRVEILRRGYINGAI